MDREPAPALVRGLHLLRLLAAGGPATLEELVRGTAIPRSSLARMLQALATAGVAIRDGQRRWAAAVRIEPCEPQRGLDDRLPLLGRAVAATGLRAELWRFDRDGLGLVEVAEPPAWPVRVFIYPGWRPDLRELMAPVLLWWAQAARAPAPRAWHWRGRRRVWLPAARVRRLADAARADGAAVCPAPNHHGLVRHALPLHDRDGAAAGVLAVVSAGPAPGAVAALRALLSGR